MGLPSHFVPMLSRWSETIYILLHQFFKLKFTNRISCVHLVLAFPQRLATDWVETCEKTVRKEKATDWAKRLGKGPKEVRFTSVEMNENSKPWDRNRNVSDWATFSENSCCKFQGAQLRRKRQKSSCLYVFSPVRLCSSVTLCPNCPVFHDVQGCIKLAEGTSASFVAWQGVLLVKLAIFPPKSYITWGQLITVRLQLHGTYVKCPGLQCSAVQKTRWQHNSFCFSLESWTSLMEIGTTAFTCTRLIVTRPENAISHTAVANQEQRCQEHQTANCARFSFQEKAEQVQHHEHRVIVQQSWVQRLRDEQNWNQPLQAIHPDDFRLVSVALRSSTRRLHVNTQPATNLCKLLTSSWSASARADFQHVGLQNIRHTSVHVFVSQTCSALVKTVVSNNFPHILVYNCPTVHTSDLNCSPRLHAYSLSTAILSSPLKCSF